MRAKIIRIGNSRGIRIPKVLLEEIGLEGEVGIKVRADGLLVSPINASRKEARETMLLSEKVLAADWDRSEEDVAWASLASVKS